MSQNLMLLQVIDAFPRVFVGCLNSIWRTQTFTNALCFSGNRAIWLWSCILSAMTISKEPVCLCAFQTTSVAFLYMWSTFSRLRWLNVTALEWRTRPSFLPPSLCDRLQHLSPPHSCSVVVSIILFIVCLTITSFRVRNIAQSWTQNIRKRLSK